MHKIKEQLMQELKELEKKGKLSAGDLDVIHKLTATIKNIDKIEMYEEYQDEGEQQYRSYGGYGSYEGGMSNANRRGSTYVRGYYRGGRGGGRGYSREGGLYGGDSYEGGYSSEGSYARGGQGGGRGYSRAEAKSYMVEQLEEMMQEADPREKEAIKRCIKQIEND